VTMRQVKSESCTSVEPSGIGCVMASYRGLGDCRFGSAKNWRVGLKAIEWPVVCQVKIAYFLIPDYRNPALKV